MLSNYIVSKLLVCTIIFSVFVVSLTEDMQISDALSASSTKIILETNVGETQLFTWPVINDESEVINLEFYATGPGSELLVFEEFITMDPKTRQEIEIFVIIPEDHEDNIEFRPNVFALKRGHIDENSGAAMAVNVQMKTIPIIKIGNNPIYTPEQPNITEVENTAIPTEKTEEEQEKIETLEEKLARIQDANKETTKVKEITNNPIKINENVDENDIQSQKNIINENQEYIEEPIFVSEPTSDEEPSQIAEEGGCLIATAAYGSELAPQIQSLREIRDNVLFSTISGNSFMTGFNQLYYSFSPTIADYERENPIFKEAVKIGLTPMLSTLSIMTLANEGSEFQVLGLGISVIVLNLAIYIVIPIAPYFVIKKHLRK